MQTRRKIICRLVLLSLLIFALPMVVHAVFPSEINYQGYLTDTGGIPMNGTVNMTFRLYNSETALVGDEVWIGTYSVTANNGVYSVILGETPSTIDPAIFAEQLWLGIEVETNGEMVPRQKLTATAYSIQAGTAESVDWANITGKPVNIDTDSSDDLTTATSFGGDYGNLQLGNSVVGTNEIDSAQVQSRVSGSCGTNTAIQLINENGTVACQTVYTGDITSVTPGTGLTGGGITGAVSLSVNVPFALTSGSGSPIISATNTANYGGALSGVSNSGDAIYGEVLDPSQYGGYAVHGKATTPDGYVARSGYFEATGGAAFGVTGIGTGTSSGTGVQGTGTTRGGDFTASGTTGRAVEGYASSSTGTTYGGYFRSVSSLSGIGIHTEGTKAVEAIGTGAFGIGVSASGMNYDFFAAGTGVDYGTSSSIRWKRNIVEIEGALDMVMNMRGVYFDWDEEHGGGHDMGLSLRRLDSTSLRS